MSLTVMVTWVQRVAITTPPLSSSPCARRSVYRRSAPPLENLFREELLQQAADVTLRIHEHDAAARLLRQLLEEFDGPRPLGFMKQAPPALQLFDQPDGVDPDPTLFDRL